MNNLDKDKRVQSSRSRNVFDLSHDYLFTATTGQLRPVTHDILMPGDTVDGKFDFFVRSMPMATPAMISVQFLVDYFFVPFDLIYLPFSNYWTGSKEYPFAVGTYSPSNSVNSELPYLDVSVFMDNGSPWHSSSNYQQNRLYDDLGLSGASFNSDSSFIYQRSSSSNVRIFPWQCLAYNAIYQFYYRNDEYEAFAPTTYSIGLEPNSSLAQSLSLVPVMRYVNREEDYFTSIKKSPLVPSSLNARVDLGSITTDFVHDLQNDLPYNNSSNNFQKNMFSRIFGESDLNSAYTDIQNGLLHLDFEDGELYNSSSNVPNSVNQLRALFAMEKLYYVLNMSRKSVDALTFARLGYNPPTDVRHEVQHLGHDSFVMDIQEIVSGSNTFDASSGTGSALGDLAGQGKGVLRAKGFKRFTAPTHGALMTIFTCRTKPRYVVGALRKDIISNISDFFTPEFDNLGMVPLYYYETKLINKIPQASSVDIPTSLTSQNPFTIVGWQYRYEYLKRNISRSSLAFMPSSAGVGDNSSDTPSFGFNSYSQWSFSRIPFDYVTFVTSQDGKIYRDGVSDYYSAGYFEDCFKVQPNELDNIMLLKWLEEPPQENGVLTENWILFPWLAYQRDPFIVDGHFTCRKVSRMSVYSMPKFMD